MAVLLCVPANSDYRSDKVNIEEIGSFEELAQDHADGWREIVSNSTAATIFQTWEWTNAWWRHFGKRKRLWALRFVDNGKTVGYSALFLPARPALVRTALFVGTGVSDSLDLIAAPGTEDAVAEAFRAYLQENCSRWDWIDLKEVRPGSVAERLVGASKGVRVEPWQEGVSPYTPLPTSWATYRTRLSKNLRESIGRNIRKVERKHNVEYRVATAETLEADLEDLFELHQRHWNQQRAPGVLGSGQIRQFHKDVARALLEAGMLRLHLLCLDGKARAVNYCFQRGAVLYYYQSGYDPEFANLGLGTLLFAHLIRYAIEADHAEEFDLLRGDEAYKYRWGAVTRLTMRLSLTHSGLRSSAPAYALRTAEQSLRAGIRRAGLRPRRLAYQMRTLLSPTGWIRCVSAWKSDPLAGDRRPKLTP
jgi:CelD/BcsL family acetyltransferase involved in cellulose biosynthesis